MSTDQQNESSGQTNKDKNMEDLHQWLEEHYPGVVQSGDSLKDDEPPPPVEVSVAFKGAPEAIFRSMRDLLRGKTKNRPRLTTAQVASVKRRVANGESKRVVADSCGITMDSLNALLRGRTYRA